MFPGAPVPLYIIKVLCRPSLTSPNTLLYRCFYLWVCLLYGPYQHDDLIDRIPFPMSLWVIDNFDFRGANAAWHEEVQVHYSFTSCPADVMRTCWTCKHGHWDSLNQQYKLQCEQESLLTFLIRPFCRIRYKLDILDLQKCGDVIPEIC